MMHAMERRVVVLVLALTACSKPGPQGDAGAATSGDAGTKDESLGAIARAEDARSARDVPPELRTSHDVAARRRSARALARIADAASLEGLVAHLADDDPETLAWAAYGLGYACKGHEDAHVKMLAARAASLPPASTGAAGTRGAAELDPRLAIARATGRCGGATAERTLVALLETGGAWKAPALLGLGDLATRKKQLGPEAITALLERVTRDPDSDAAFYALSRADAGEAFGKRVTDAAVAALGRPGEHRLLAIKTLGRAGKELARDTAAQLGRVVGDASGFTPAERAEAARSLGTLGEPGALAAGDALGRLLPDRDAAAIEQLIGPEFHVLHTLVGALGGEPPKKTEPVLRALSGLALPSAPKVALGRRLAELRCAAALGLARGGYDAEVLRKCDVESSEISEQTRLTSLLRRPLTGERKAAFRAFTRSAHLRVREAAVEALAQHPEVGDAAAAILADALGSKKPGLVATAAEVIDGHPDRALVLAASERRAALDPHAPPPTANPAQEIAPDVARALAAALAEPWPEDRFETRIALIEAAAAVGHPQAKAAAQGACTDPNPVMRERAQKALRTLGEKVDACNGAARAPTPAAEIGAPLARPQKLVFTLDDAEVAPLTLVLEPELSPITATRLASLARSGFFRGIVVHRVVPGFVVQLGDPDGDGYGGSGTPLRCETSPVPFAPLDVGMALAGRDTGSSQIFVTLSRTPHLDGEYTRVGRAEGPWAAVAQGDVVTDARLVE
ncbi:MAG: Peptidyl-prolyl cis-trans isomerase [Labilithrix sp.]|nr:Peptidyl-prolyl cis-trans isomerase [Labilithrix sp.]